MRLQLTLQYYKALGKVTERRNSWKLRAATAHSWTWWTSSTVSQHSYLNRRLLTNPWPCVKKQHRITIHSRNYSTSNNRTAERQNGRAQPSMTPPITLSTLTARRHARGLGTRQPKVASLRFYLFFTVFTVQQWCKHLIYFCIQSKLTVYLH